MPDNTLAVYAAIDAVADWLAARSVYLPEAIKRRDPREPGRAEKERAEDALEMLISRRFAAQKRQLRAYLSENLPERKALTIGLPGGIPGAIPPAIWRVDPVERLLLIFFIKTAQDGVRLFAESATFDVDWTLVNTRAAAWVQQYTSELLSGLDATTQADLRRALQAFVEMPGVTVGDVINALPFGLERSRMIAVTEITRVYAESVQRAGEELKTQFPDVRVVKRWWTNRDDRVCPICWPLHGNTVAIDETFGDGALTNPPAHTRCRCWMSTQTELANG